MLSKNPTHTTELLLCFTADPSVSHAKIRWLASNSDVEI